MFQQIFSNLFIIFFIICTLTSFIGCSNQRDELPPNITVSLPEEDQLFFTGHHLPFVAELQDGKELAEFIINIQPDFPDFGQSEGWDTTIIKTIVGEATQVDIQIPIAQQTKVGNYLFVALAKDISNNLSDTVRRNIQIINRQDTIPPSISLLNPQPVNGTVTVLSSQLVYVANLRDNLALDKAVISIFQTDSLNNTNLLIQQPENLNGVTQKQLVLSVAMPSKKGVYPSKFTLSDGVNNRTVLSFNLNVQ